MVENFIMEFSKYKDAIYKKVRKLLYKGGGRSLYDG